MTGALKHVTVVGGGKLFGVNSADNIWYNDNYKGNKLWLSFALDICKSLKYFKLFFFIY